MNIYIGIADNQPTIYTTLEDAMKHSAGEFVYKLNLWNLQLTRVDDTW